MTPHTDDHINALEKALLFLKQEVAKRDARIAWLEELLEREKARTPRRLNPGGICSCPSFVDSPDYRAWRLRNKVPDPPA